MTATVVESWLRRPTPVEVIHLSDATRLHAADIWLRAHGVHSAHRHPAFAARSLLVSGDVARLGQWLVRDLATGEFELLDDGAFRAHHQQEVAA